MGINILLIIIESYDHIYSDYHARGMHFNYFLQNLTGRKDYDQLCTDKKSGT